MFRSTSSYVFWEQILVVSPLVSKLSRRNEWGWASTTAFSLQSTNDICHSPSSPSILYSPTFDYNLCWTWWITWWHDQTSHPWDLWNPYHHALLRPRLLYSSNCSNNWAGDYLGELKWIAWSPLCNHEVTSSWSSSNVLATWLLYFLPAGLWIQGAQRAQMAVIYLSFHGTLARLCSIWRPEPSNHEDKKYKVP